MAFLIQSNRLVEAMHLKNCRHFVSIPNRTYKNPDDRFNHNMKTIDSTLKYNEVLSKDIIDQAVKSMQSAESISLIQSLNLIKACRSLYPVETPEVSRDTVSAVWNSVSKCYSNLDISHFNALFRVYIDIGHSFSIDNFLQDLKNKGIEPNKVTHQLMIQKYCLDGDINEASKVITSMKEHGVPINRKIFNCFIVGYNKLGDIKSAEEILPLMIQSGVEPSIDTYIHLMMGYANEGKLSELNGLKDKHDLSLNMYDNSNIMYQFIINGHDEVAMEYIKSVLPDCRKSSSFQLTSTIVKLVNCGKIAETQQLIYILQDEQTFPESMLEITTAYVKQLIKIGHPLKDILDICREMSREKGLEYHTEVVLGHFLTEGDMDTSQNIITLMKDEHLGEIRMQYLFPIFMHYVNKQDNEGCQKIIEQMNINNFTFDTNMIVAMMKYFKGLSYDSPKILNILYGYGLNKSQLNIPLTLYYLDCNSLKDLASFIGSSKSMFKTRFIAHLIRGLIDTGDVKSTVEIVNLMLVSHPDMQNNNGNNNDFSIQRFLDILLTSKISNKQIIKVIQEMENYTMGISKEMATDLKMALKVEMNPELENILSILQSRTSLRKAYKDEHVTYYNTPPDQQFQSLGLNELVKMYHDKKHTNYVYKLLVNRCIELERTDVLTELLQDDALKFVSAGQISKIIILYANCGNIKEALSITAELKRIHPDASLDLYKIRTIAHQLVKNGNKQELLDFIDNNLLDATKYTLKDDKSLFFNLIHPVNNIFDEDLMTEMTQSFSKKGFKVDSYNQKIERIAAISRGEFREVLDLCKSNQFLVRCVASRQHLLCKLIQQENSEMLEELLGYITNVSGDVIALQELGIAFICCGRKIQAQKIFMSIGTELHGSSMQTMAEYISKSNNVQFLEDLLDVTKDIHNSNRISLYSILLDAYKKEDNVDKIANIWTSLQDEENLQISDDLIRELSLYLVQKGRILPFMDVESLQAAPFRKQVTQARRLPPLIKSEPEPSTPKNKRNLSSTLHENYQDELKSIFSSEKDLVDLIKELKEKVIKTSAGDTEISRIFGHLFNLLSEKNEYDMIQFLEDKVPDQVKHLCHFTIARYYVKADKIQEIFDKLLPVTEENCKFVENVTGLDFINSVSDKPEFMGKILLICEELKNRGTNCGYVALCANYILECKFEEADEIMKSHMQNISEIKLNGVLTHCRMHKKTEPLEYLKRLETDEVKLKRINQSLSRIRVLISKINIKQ